MTGIPSGSEQPRRSTANYARANPDPKPAPSCGRGRPSKVPEETDNVSIAASSTYSLPLLAKSRTLPGVYLVHPHTLEHLLEKLQ